MPPFDFVDSVFFNNTPLDKNKVLLLLRRAAGKCDDADLFLQQKTSEHFVFDDGRIKSAGTDFTRGFGLRVVQGDTFAYAHSTDIGEDALKRAAQNVLPVHAEASCGEISPDTPERETSLYAPQDSAALYAGAQKTAFLAQVDAYVRAQDPRTVQATISLSFSFDTVKIMRPDGFEAQDARPLAHFSVRVVLEENGRRETGSCGFGGRYGYDRIFDEAANGGAWKKAADAALAQARVNLSAVNAPVGEMPVVLGNGWCGVLLHEAVGHGLEGDFIRKKTSVFTDKIGEQVCAKGVTIIDDGSVPERRGSLNIDDEGTPTRRNVLVEDGVLKGYMHDRMNARLTRALPTGNARRESFAAPPQVRMTNTFMQSGECDFEDMLKGVDSGIYAASFSGGQVDIVSGDFVFCASEAYKIENGKITTPVKNAMLIGNGLGVMNAIDRIGNDSCLDDGIGSCGKGGQSVPVGVGQPCVRLSKITVGGAADKP